jgi:hypothetical protein
LWLQGIDRLNGLIIILGGEVQENSGDIPFVMVELLPKRSSGSVVVQLMLGVRKTSPKDALQRSREF